jgi:anti-sigma factor RsiW
MNRHVSELLSAYIDGALGVRDVERVKAHLDGCVACMREYQELQRVQRLLRTLPDPAPRPGFADRLHWRLHREIAADAGRPSPLARLIALVPAHSWGVLRVALAASALVIMLGAPWAWFTGQSWMPGVSPMHRTPLDTDAYVRHYLVLSSDRSLVDEATTTFVSADLGVPDQPTR